jgi:hypothetical protein
MAWFSFLDAGFYFYYTSDCIYYYWYIQMLNYTCIVIEYFLHVHVHIHTCSPTCTWICRVAQIITYNISCLILLYILLLIYSNVELYMYRNRILLTCTCTYMFTYMYMDMSGGPKKLYRILISIVLVVLWRGGGNPLLQGPEYWSTCTCYIFMM